MSNIGDERGGLPEQGKLGADAPPSHEALAQLLNAAAQKCKRNFTSK